MSEKKHSRHDRKHDREHKNEQIELDEEDKWHPTPEQFAAFQANDADLCNGNLRILLSGRYPLTLKELKDSTLHSAQTVDRQVTAWLQSGYILETKGKYSLNPNYKGS